MRPLVAVLTLLWASQAAAQTNCGPREAVTERLDQRYGERFGGGGMQSAQSIFEVWVNHEKGTWTILRTMASGISCVMASGTNWRDGIKVPLGVPG